jgi:hypothetical protein
MARELAPLKQPSPKGSIRDSGSAMHEGEREEKFLIVESVRKVS